MKDETRDDSDGLHGENAETILFRSDAASATSPALNIMVTDKRPMILWMIDINYLLPR